MLVAEGMGTHMAKGYVYFAMAFSLFVEMLNMRYQQRHAAPPRAVLTHAGASARPSSPARPAGSASRSRAGWPATASGSPSSTSTGTGSRRGA